MKFKKWCQTQAATELKDQLPDNMQRAMSLSTEKGSSNWLSTLPTAEHGFALHIGAFQDAIIMPMVGILRICLFNALVVASFFQ